MSTITLPTRLPSAVCAAFASVVGSIPGCILDGRLTLVERSGRKDPRPLVSADVRGRSPSLHAVAMDWHTVLPDEWSPERMEADTSGMVDHLVRAYGHKLTIQRERAKAGIAVDEPFPMKTLHEHMLRYDHLHVDRGALALAIAKPGMTPVANLSTLRSIVAKEVKDLHYNVSKYRGGATLDNNGGRIDEMADGRRMLRIKAHFGGKAMMYGSHLTIHGKTLPEQVVLALAGRPLGEVAEVHPALDGRIVTDAGIGEAFGRQSIWVDLAPDPMPLGGLDQLGGGDARLLDHLVAGAPAWTRPGERT